MKYHALFVIFEKADFFNCRLLQIIGGALRDKIRPISYQTQSID